MKRRALISVSDKNGLLDLARGLLELGFELVSTGGTASTLAAAGLAVTKVSTVTGFPEILGGRVKTLHPRIHAGILADLSDVGHRSELGEHEIQPFELVVVNLYPFEATASNPNAGPDQVVEQIDIGGPSMVRAAAKNFAHVAVVVDPADYPAVLAELRAGGVNATTRRRLALAAFRHTGAYDAAIAGWFAGEIFPATLIPVFDRVLEPRYGENPHQRAAVYQRRGGGGLFGGFQQLQGKELSWNNLLDTDAARRLVADLDQPAVVIVKHGNPCGVGLGDSLDQAWGRALAADPVSAFGSIVALNRPLDRATAAAIAELFVEVVITPAVDQDAAALLAPKSALRLLAAPLPSSREGVDLRSIDGGVLAQDLDLELDEPGAWTCPTRRRPTAEESRALDLAWRIVRHVKSNAIVLATENASVGVGAGQMSRLDSCRLAIDKAVTQVAGAVAASDAFFPFRDGLDTLAGAGIRAIVQPGGSKRDDEVIAAADEHDIAMVFTGRRHFRH
jgi:phosphoribosylaminoimidazolecarboxamide formyltransferase/IMP cyclohydrolase